MARQLTEYSALTFDCYGTMIDWEGGIWDAFQPVIASNHRSDITRSIALESFAKHETAQEIDTPGLIYPASSFGMDTNESMDKAFGESVPHWPAFADSADALRILKKHFKLVILSNVNQAGFASSNLKLGVEFDAIYTAEDVGSYKPNDANFEYLLKNIKNDLGVEPKQILHTAQSLHHDHVPATRAGLDKAWIDRQDLANSENWGATAFVENRPDVDFRYVTLMEMAEAIS